MLNQALQFFASGRMGAVEEGERVARACRVNGVGGGFRMTPAVGKLASFYQVNRLNNEADESQMRNEIEHHYMT